jgi:hypothetical protein
LATCEIFVGCGTVLWTLFECVEWMNDNNIYSRNQHHKCFSDGSCKTLKYKVYNSTWSVHAVFTYWYVDMIYKKNYDLWDYI